LEKCLGITHHSEEVLMDFPFFVLNVFALSNGASTLDYTTTYQHSYCSLSLFFNDN